VSRASFRGASPPADAPRRPNPPPASPPPQPCLPLFSFPQNTPPPQNNNNNNRTLLFTHLHFDVKYNEEEGHVIEWNVLPDPSSAVDISEGASSSSASSSSRRAGGAGRKRRRASLRRGAGRTEAEEEDDQALLEDQEEEEDQEDQEDQEEEENDAGDGEDGEDEALEVTFSYSARWQKTETRYADRMARYEFLPLDPVHLEIHWFSIVNSCVTVLLLTGFMATILMRVLRADLARFGGGGGTHGGRHLIHGGGGAIDEEEAAAGGGGGGGLSAALAAAGGADEDESGWKYLHGDVFRFPPRKSLFASFLGTGTQLLLLSFFIFVLALLGAFYPYNRGAMFTALIMLYAFTAGVAGYVSASTYRQHGGAAKGWARNVALTVVVYCGPFAATFCFLNTVAIAYRSTAALPFGTIVVMIVLWSLVTIPLTVLGGVAGKNSSREFDAPTRSNKYPREVPELPWYRSVLPQMVLTGFLPFSAIYVGAF
jgi:hypothetical protein